MTQEEFTSLSKEEFHALSEEERLKHWIRFSEERYISYKKLLEEIHKDKTVLEPGDWRVEHRVWLKEHLRECKNSEESNLKELRIEMEHLRQGLSPPWCYPEYWKNRIKKVKAQCSTCEGKGTVLQEEDINQMKLL